MNQSGTTKSSKQGKKVVFWILSILAVAAILVFAYYLSNRSLDLKSSFITNITPHSATVVWRTERPTIGAVVVQEVSSSEVESVPLSTVYRSLTSKENVYWDTRDLVENEDGGYEKETAEAYYTHHVTISGLESDQSYAFAILNNYIASDITNLSNINTTEEEDSITEPSPVYGMIEAGDDVNIQDAIVMSTIVEANNPDIDKERSQYVSTVLVDGSYVFDVGNLKTAELDELFSALLDDDRDYTISMQILTPEGFVQHEVVNGNFQPVDTLTIEKEEIETESSWFDTFVSPVYAKCNSECVGDCQGCNLPTDGDWKCATYGCGYMSYCCSGDNDGDGSNDDECNGHCSNGTQDCGETGRDCGGGGCATCAGGAGDQSGKCSGSTPCKEYGGDGCVERNPATGSCGCAIDGRTTTESGETGRNCGGPHCPSCTNAGSHCFDRVKNEGEDGVDCGGDCAASCAPSGTPDQGMYETTGTKDVGEKCSNDGAVYNCKNRPDWNCWCFGGYVSYYHSKSSNIYAQTQAQAAADAVQQEQRARTYYYGYNSKLGINTAMVDAVNLGIIPDLENTGSYLKILQSDDQAAIDALVNEWNNLPPGVVPILRYCVGDCPFRDPKVAARVAREINARVDRPIAVVGGPNEPLLHEPWTSQEQASCPSGDCTGDVSAIARATAQWMEVFLSETNNETEMIRLSPAFNGTHPNFQVFMEEMRKNNAPFDELDGYAATAYNIAGKSISEVVADLKAQGFHNIYLTEVGMYNNPENPTGGGAGSRQEAYNQLVAELSKLEVDPDIVAYLLFNPINGLNPDSNFDYNELSEQELRELIGGHSDSGTTPEVAEAPARVIEAQQPVVPPTTSGSGGGGGSCNRGTFVRRGNASCCQGAHLTVCIDSSGNGYIEGDGGSDDRDAFYRIDGNAAGNLGGNIDSGHADYGQVGYELCTYGHISKFEGDPEHEWMCITRGGGNVGVSPGDQGRVPEFDFISKTHAQSEELDPGVYSVSGVNVDVTTLTVDVIHPGTLSFFYDDNGNGTYDSGEQYLTDEEANAVEVELNKETDILYYDLSPGWNSLAFPLYMEGEDTSKVLIASELAAYLKASGVDATHVAAYRNGIFLIYSLRMDTKGELRAYGIDFGIMPGEGYFIKTSTGGEIALAGQKVAGSLPVYLNAGWNLTGYYNEDESPLSAIDLLDDMQTNDIPADILSKWEDGKYTSVVKDGVNEYGLDFFIHSKYSYWTRVDNDTEFVRGVYSP